MPRVRIQAQSSEGGPESETRAVVRRARALLARAVREAWQENLLSRDKDGLFSGVLGAEGIDALIARTELELETPAPRPAAEAASEDPALGRLRALVQAAGGGEGTVDVLVLALAVELDASTRMLAAYLRGMPSGATLTVGSLVLALGEARTAELVIALGAGAPVRRHRLVEVVERRAGGGSDGAGRAAPGEMAGRSRRDR